MTELLFISMMLSNFEPFHKMAFNVSCWSDNVQDCVLVKVCPNLDEAIKYASNQDCKIEWIN
jgi:hypothetical protein